MSTKLAVRTLEPADYDTWTRLVLESPDGSIYATPQYLDVLCRAAGGSFRILAAYRGEELVGGVPLYERATSKGRLAGPRLLLYYQGPVLRRFPSKYPSQESSRRIEALAALAGAVEGEGYSKVVLKGRHTIADVRPFLARGWHAWPSYSYVIPLSDLAGQWDRMEQNLRRLVDRCAGQGLVVTDDDDFPGFHRLHLLTMKRHSADAYLPEPAFRHWFELLHAAGLCRLYQARLPDGQAVAAQIVLLGGHPICHTVTAASDPAHRQLGASAFLRWEGFKRLAELGCHGTDLTDAALNPVTHFKSQLGGELVANLVVETRGSFRWRATTGTERSYRALREAAGTLLRRWRQPEGAQNA